jgi:hypothetical protein
MTGVESWLVRIRSPQFRRGTHRDDLLITKDDSAVFDDPESAQSVSTLRSAGEGEELGGGMDEHKKTW